MKHLLSIVIITMFACSIKPASSTTAVFNEPQSLLKLAAQSILADLITGDLVLEELAPGKPKQLPQELYEIVAELYIPWQKKLENPFYLSMKTPYNKSIFPDKKIWIALLKNRVKQLTPLEIFNLAQEVIHSKKTTIVKNLLDGGFDVNQIILDDSNALSTNLLGYILEADDAESPNWAHDSYDLRFSYKAFDPEEIEVLMQLIQKTTNLPNNIMSVKLALTPILLQALITKGWDPKTSDILSLSTYWSTRHENPEITKQAIINLLKIGANPLKPFKLGDGDYRTPRQLLSKNQKFAESKQLLEDAETRQRAAANVSTGTRPTYSPTSLPPAPSVPEGTSPLPLNMPKR